MKNTHQILVVDDNAISRTATTLTVQSFGLETEEASDGEEALKKVQVNYYAVILMDCNMPTMNGFECTKKIRELEKNTTVRMSIIGLTSNVASDIKEQCLEAGMDAYINKACSFEELRHQLSKWAIRAV